MKIEIVPVADLKFTKAVKQESIELASIEPETYFVDLKQIFAEFLELEVGDGAASTDTIRNYILHTKQYFIIRLKNKIKIIEKLSPLSLEA